MSVGMKLQGKRALVTGSDSGIGQAIAIAFGREGAHVAVHYHSDKAGAEATAADLRARGRETAVLQSDLSNPENGEKLFEEAVKALGGIDILVNCAGTDVEGPDESVYVSLHEFHRVIHINLIAPWVLCQAAAKHMGDRGGGQGGPGGVILNITSVHEEIPSQGGAAYTAAKAGLRNITRNLAMELGSKGIRVNNIAPGFIATPMTREYLEDEQEMEKSRRAIPLGRPGRPDEVAQVAVFLASEDASYVTGSSYFVDGGMMQKLGGDA
ncbi:MAG: family oxidoreductase [Fibrobacteria bacterium]|jgi:glucose 1-dehydrogenase|nr:family oxidoreductase [Fibrobacteria bacterium]